MKINIILFALIILSCVSCKTITGKYYDQYGGILDMKPDFTFVYQRHHNPPITMFSGISVHLIWVQGKFNLKKDTVYFTPLPVYDTVQSSHFKEHLVLSSTMQPELFTDGKFTLLNDLANQFPSQHLNFLQHSKNKLIFKRNKLYELDSIGKINYNRFYKK